MSDLLHRLALLLAAESERALAAEERLEQMTRERDKEREEWASRRCECSASDSCKMARERDEAVHACAAALAERITWYQRGREEALKEKP